MGSTTYGLLPWPDGTDRIQDGDDKIKALAEALDLLYAPWTAYTPTLINITVGASTMTGAYWRLGKAVMFWARAQLGAGFAMTSSPGLTLPVPAKTVQSFGPMWAGVADTGTNNYQAYALPTSQNNVFFYQTSNVNGNLSTFSATSPFTWAVNDELYLRGTYEAA